MNDQEKISPYNINTTLSRQVMRIKKKINEGITSWSNASAPYWRADSKDEIMGEIDLKFW